MKTFRPNEECKTSETTLKRVYHYCDEKGKPIYKTKEIYLKEDKYVFYPYSINPQDGSVRSKKIKNIEFIGWKSIKDIPKDFNITGRYGFRSMRIRQLFSYLYPHFKEIDSLKFGINIQNRFSLKKISMNWSDIEPILRKIANEKRWYDRTRKQLIHNELSTITTKLRYEKIHLSAGQLDGFLRKFDSFEKVTKHDIDSLSKVLDTAPPSKISITSNFIKTRNTINKVFIEDLIKKFEKLMIVKKDNEKDWQSYFGNNSWILSHLFPFEVILRQQEAYVGGKTLENKEGRVVDYLFQNGLKDNFALLEIKTHRKSLLSDSPYRKPDVFSYSKDLSGGISQCLDQKDKFIKEFGNKEKILDPKCILVIGLKSELNSNQSTCFELLRSNQSNVDVVTFDELLSKMKGLLNVMSE